MTQAFRGTPATVRALFPLTKFYCWSDRTPYYFKINTDSELVLPLPQIKIKLPQMSATPSLQACYFSFLTCLYPLFERK